MGIVKVEALGDGGIVKDQEGYELPSSVWTDGNNVRFSQGWATAISGTAQIVNPSATPYFVISYYTPTTRYLAYAGLAKIYVNDGTTETDITPVVAPTGAATDKWTGGILSGVLLLNNGKDVPWYYGGTGIAATVPGWDATWRCKSFRPFKNYIVALNITKGANNYPYTVKWSTEIDPGSITAAGDWDETNPALDAGEQPLGETPDKLVDQLPLGDINIIYKERSMYGMQFIGAPFIWRFFRLPGELGMLTSNCAVNTPLGHVVLAQGDVYLHNGGQPNSIIDQKMRNWLFSSINPNYYDSCFVTLNPRKQEVWVCFPEVGQTTCTKALVWCWTNNTTSIRDLQYFTAGTSGVLNYLGDTWASDNAEWDSESTSLWSDGSDFNVNDTRLFMASTSIGIQGMDTGSVFAGVPFTSYVERTGLHFDSPERVKLLTAIWPRIDATAGTVVSIQAGGSMDAETAPTWSTAVNFTVGTDQKVDTFASGRYLSYRYSATGQWRTKSAALDVQEQGAF